MDRRAKQERNSFHSGVSYQSSIDGWRGCHWRFIRLCDDQPDISKRQSTGAARQEFRYSRLPYSPLEIKGFWATRPVSELMVRGTIPRGAKVSSHGRKPVVTGAQKVQAPEGRQKFTPSATRQRSIGNMARWIGMGVTNPVRRENCVSGRADKGWLGCWHAPATS